MRPLTGSMGVGTMSKRGCRRRGRQGCASRTASLGESTASGTTVALCRSGVTAPQPFLALRQRQHPRLQSMQHCLMTPGEMVPQPLLALWQQEHPCLQSMLTSLGMRGGQMPHPFLALRQRHHPRPQSMQRCLMTPGKLVPPSLYCRTLEHLLPVI